MANYGQIFSANDIARQLKEANRTYEGLKTWEQLYGSVNLAEQQMMSSLKQDYSKEIGQAYLSSLQQEQDILASNIGQGYKEQMLSENQLALEEAFAAYQQNYLQGVQSISETTDKATGQITSQLEQQADYTKQFAEAQYGYLSHLYDEYADTGLFNEDEWKRYLITEGEETRLKTWEELTRAAYDEYTDEQGNIVKEWTSLYDDQGNLTIVGADFYDQMMNQFGYEGKFITNSGTEYNVPSFGAWLNEENEELFNWATSYNPYNYTEGGTQQGSFKTLVGLTSTDYQYEFMERYGGLTKKQLDSKYESYISKAEDLANKINSKSGDKTISYMNDIKSLVNDVESLAKQLDIDDDINFDEVRNTIQTYIDEAGKIDNEALEIYAERTLGTSALYGATLGAAFGPAGIGIGLLLGAAVGAGVGTYEASKADEEYTKARREQGLKAKDVYMNLVNSMVQYSEQKRRQKQIDFYNNNK